jgi:DNA-binding response OmpR family regulator
MRRSGRVVSREALIDAVWGADADVEPNTVDVFVSSLRKKIGGPPKLIHTIRGFGFSLRET